MSEPVEKQIVGTSEGITEKPSGWFDINVSIPGKQYPIRVSTKSSKLVEQVREIGAGIATWTFKESESDTINPNSGKPYLNRWLEGVEAGAQAQTETSTASGTPEAHHEPLHFADKDRAITRMACLKAASQIYMGRGTLLDTDSEEAPDIPLAVMKAAQRFEQWVYRDLSSLPFSSAPPLSEHDQRIPFGE